MDHAVQDGVWLLEQLGCGFIGVMVLLSLVWLAGYISDAWEGKPPKDE